MNEEFAGDLGATLDAVWTQLGRGARDSAAPARHPTLATLGSDGWPQARTVVLRRADRAGALVEVHTDARTAKVAELRRAPRAALHLWLPALRLQIRLRARFEVLEGAETAALWRALPETARGNYGVRPAPGTPIDRPDGFARQADRDAFALLRGHVEQIEALHLGETHSRARYDRRDDWSGRWLAP